MAFSKSSRNPLDVYFALGGGGDSLAAISLASSKDGVAVVAGNSLSCVETYVTTKGRQNPLIMSQVKSDSGLSEDEFQEYLSLVLFEPMPLFYRLRNDRTDEETTRFEELALRIGSHYNSLVQESRQAHQYPNVPICMIYSIGGTSEKYIDSEGESMNPSKLEKEIATMESAISQLLQSLQSQYSDIRVTGIDTGGDVMIPDNARDSLVHKTLFGLHRKLNFRYQLMIIGLSVDGHHGNPLELMKMMEDAGFSCENSIATCLLDGFKKDSTYELGRANHVVALMWEYILSDKETEELLENAKKFLKQAKESVNERREPHKKVFANLLEPEQENLGKLCGIWTKWFYPNHGSIHRDAQNYLNVVSVPMNELDTKSLFELGRNAAEAYANFVPDKTIDKRVTKLAPQIASILILCSDGKKHTKPQLDARKSSNGNYALLQDTKNSLDGSNGPNIWFTGDEPLMNLFQLAPEEQIEFLDRLICFFNENRSKIFEMFIEKIQDEGLRRFVSQKREMFHLALFCQTWAEDGTANFSIPSPHFQCVFLPEENAFDCYEVYLEPFQKFWNQMAETYPKKFVCVHSEF